MTIVRTIYQCNKCGIEMDNQERKYIILEVGEDFKEMVDNLHLCPECGAECIDFANDKIKAIQRDKKTGRFKS